MKLASSIKPLSQVKARAAEIIREVSDQDGKPVVITLNGEAKAVLMGVRQYDELQESLALLKILAMSGRDLDEGRMRPAREALADIRKGLSS